MNAQQQKGSQQLYLIGYRGSGKSTVGSIVAEKLQRPLLDTDRMVERAAGCTIAQIFGEQGEATFRDYEQAAILDASQSPPSVVALGGGAILRETNRQLLQRTGWTVWLQANPTRLAARIAADQRSRETRPGLTDLDPLDEVRQILQARTPLYQAASDWNVDTDERTPLEIAEQIYAWFCDRDSVGGPRPDEGESHSTRS